MQRIAMIQSNYTTTSYGYGQAVPVMTAGEASRTNSAKQEEREVYGTSLLMKLDQKGYDGFLRATNHLGHDDTKLAAQTLEKAAAASAANQYANSHDIDAGSEMSMVYAFFEEYQDVVGSEQIKHLLNTRLMDRPVVETESFSSEALFEDFTNQLGGMRTLDIMA